MKTIKILAEKNIFFFEGDQEKIYEKHGFVFTYGYDNKYKIGDILKEYRRNNAYYRVDDQQTVLTTMVDVKEIEKELFK